MYIYIYICIYYILYICMHYDALPCLKLQAKTKKHISRMVIYSRKKLALRHKSKLQTDLFFFFMMIIPIY